VESWAGGTVVLSPRDQTDSQLHNLADDIRALPNGSVLLDPQFYLPHADHEGLRAHDYWPDHYSTGTFWNGSGAVTLLSKLAELNGDLGTAAFVIPGLLAANVNSDWLAIQQSLISEARRIVRTSPLIMTLALSSDATRDESQVAALLEAAPKWKADGYYVVCQHPNGEYLVSDPNWLASVLDLTAGLRLAGAQVILGYCNQQMLIAAAAKATAICSGTWMNVRSFPPEKFRVAYDEEIRQRARWYYCPQALSEYKVLYLDIAYRLHILRSLVPPRNLDGGYASALFSGQQPSSMAFSEQDAFRHYLHSLRGQVSAAEANSFDATRDYHARQLDDAETLLTTLRASGVRGQNRDFADAIDSNRAALAVLDSTRGPILRRRWSTL